MERAVCERCGEKQPVDWGAGDLCVACGAAVRREVRCAWCAEWIPAGKFCRSCGCEVVDECLYGAARMLKSAGVDRFSIAQRLRELDPEQVQNLSRIYESQLAVVLRRCEEARSCETYLLQKTHSRRLEEALVPLLPMEKEKLGVFASGPGAPIGGRPELLAEIARTNPIGMTRTLAAIALLRQGHAEREFLAAALAALQGDDHDLAVEAALGLAHWSIRLYPQVLFGGYHLGGAGIDRHRLAEVASTVASASPLRPWAAAALTLARFSDGMLPAAEIAASADEAEAHDSLRTALRDGLTSSDPDLRFTCALALGEEDIIAGELEARDEGKRTAARWFLAKHNSPAVRRCLAEGSDEIRREVLDNLWPPLPKELVEPVLRVVEQGDAQTRWKGVQLLQPTLTASTVNRLVKVALREGDLEVFKALLRSESLPESLKVVRSIIEAGLFQTLYREMSGHIDFSQGAVTRLASGNDPEIMEMLITIAGWQLQGEAGQGERPGEQLSIARKALATGRFLAQTAFCSGPAQVRLRAHHLLAYHGSSYGSTLWDWMGPQAVREFFDSPGEFLHAMTRVLKDPELEQMRCEVVEEMSEHWPELGPFLVDHRAAVGGLVSALLGLVKAGFCGDRSEVVKLLVAMVPLYPAEALPAILALLRDHDALRRPWDILPSLRDGYSVFGPCLEENPEVLAEAVGALLELVKVDDSARDYIGPPAAELLAKAATDYPRCRQEIASKIASLIADMTFVPQNMRERLVQLAEVVGLGSVAEDEGKAMPMDVDLGGSSSGHESQTPALELLDHEVLLPGEPLPTLAEYCGFMKAMSAAADPMEVVAASGLTVDQYVQCISAWGGVLSRRDDVAIRYSQLVATPDQSPN